MRWRFTLVLLLGLAAAGLLLAACGESPTPCPECTACPPLDCSEPDCAECPPAECPDCPNAECAADCPPLDCAEAECTACQPAECPEGVTAIPFESKWAASAHADAGAPAFTHWDAADPAIVPAACAKCHSESGFLDFLGADGSDPGAVNTDHPTGTVVSCEVCHNGAAASWDTVAFPSGTEVTGLGPEARCMECHQGRASKQAVDDAIANAGLTDDDTASLDLGFTDIHYKAAAATMYGAAASGGYEYEGKSYDAKHDHVPGMDTCIDCHDAHSLELKAEKCASCHTESDPKDFRMLGSLVDYDGDGDTQEGIHYEIQGLQEKVYQAMQAYAIEVAGTPIVYDRDTYPYFFADTNSDGEAGEEETTYENAYNTWTARLARAGYNYQMSAKDPGAYAHGGKYMIQLLYDSAEDLNQVLSNPVDLSAARRIDHGHFAGSERAFRNWDEEGIVPRHCAKCHTAAGLPFFLAESAHTSQSPSNGLNCATCHNDLTTFSIYGVPSVRFPQGTVVDSGDARSNLCLNCHQGLSSIASVNAAIAGLELDSVAESLEFLNIHDLAAASTLFGTEVKGAYEYNGKRYVGRFAHVDGFRNCTQCHSIHGLEVEAGACGACHQGVATTADLVNIRNPEDTADYDGDGDATEGLAGEVETLRQLLYASMQEYAAAVAGTPMAYDPDTYPYFFADTNGNRQVDEDEAVQSNRYAGWTPRLLRAAYNFQYGTKDPGAFAHNGKYTLQILHDALEDLGADVSGLARP